MRSRLALWLAAALALASAPAAAGSRSSKSGDKGPSSAPASPAPAAALRAPGSIAGGPARVSGEIQLPAGAALPASAILASPAAGLNLSVVPPEFGSVVAGQSQSVADAQVLGLATPHDVSMGLLERAAQDRRRFDGGAPTVAVLGDGVDALALGKAGHKLAPGHVHMVMDKSWMMKEGKEKYILRSALVSESGVAIQDHPEPIAVKAVLRSRRSKAASEIDDGAAQERALRALSRASRKMLKGQRIIVVGAGYVNKKPFLETAKRLGVKVVLVDRGIVDGQPNWAKDYVHEFIDADLTTDPEKGLPVAVAKIREYEKKKGKVNGITTYWEDDVVETAKLAKALGLRYHSVEAAQTARSKHLTIQTLSRKGVIDPRFTAKIGSRAELDALIASGQVPEKWFMKPDAGAEAMYTARDTDGPLPEIYDKLAALIEASGDPVFKGNKTLVLTRRLEGNELDDNFVMQNGKRLDFRPTDNWPTRPGSSKATGSTLPARMLTREELDAALDRSVEELRALGFTDGVFHVERMGKDLIEINPRPGGSYTVDWNKRALGVDEAEMLYLTAAGLPAFPLVPRKPRTHLEGAFVFTPLRGKIKRIGLTPEAEKRGLKILVEKKAGKVIDDDSDRVAMIFAEGKSHAAALKKLGPDASRWLDLELE